MNATIDTHNRHERAADTTWTAIGYRETGNRYTPCNEPAAASVETAYKPVPRPCR